MSDVSRLEDEVYNEAGEKMKLKFHLQVKAAFLEGVESVPAPSKGLFWMLISMVFTYLDDALK